MICGSEGSKSRLAKAAGAEPCGQMRDEKLHAVVVRSTFSSQNVQSTPASDHFWKLRCGKSARRCARSTFPSQIVKNTRGSDRFWKLRCQKSARSCGAKHISKSKWTKHTTLGPLLDIQSSFRVAGARDCEQNLRVSSHFQKRWQAWDIWRGSAKMHVHGRRSTKDMFMRDVRRSGRWFPEKGCILEHQICRFAQMILRDRCSTSYDLASIFRGRRSTLDRWSGKIAKRIGTRPSARHSTFHVWRKSRRILSFLMLSTSKNEEVSQHCFVFDVVNIETWGSLAALLRFWCCQHWNMKKSRRISWFSSLQKGR